MLRPVSLMLFGLVITACAGTSVSVVRTAIRPSKPADCQLKLVTIHPEDMAPGAAYGPSGEYEMIGMLSAGGNAGTDMMSEEVRQLVRPKACEIGGDVLSVLASSTFVANRYGLTREAVSFTVWAKRTQASAAVEKF